jgi:hypothetical protein
MPHDRAPAATAAAAIHVTARILHMTMGGARMNGDAHVSAGPATACGSGRYVKDVRRMAPQRIRYGVGRTPPFGSKQARTRAYEWACRLSV